MKEQKINWDVIDLAHEHWTATGSNFFCRLLHYKFLFRIKIPNYYLHQLINILINDYSITHNLYQINMYMYKCWMKWHKSESYSRVIISHTFGWPYNIINSVQSRCNFVVPNILSISLCFHVTMEKNSFFFSLATEDWCE